MQPHSHPHTESAEINIPSWLIWTIAGAAVGLGVGYTVHVWHLAKTLDAIDEVAVNPKPLVDLDALRNAVVQASDESSEV